MGEGVTSPWQKVCPLSPPNEITLCTEVYGELPFWVPVSNSPAHPWAPLAAPSFWKVWLRPCILLRGSGGIKGAWGLCPPPSQRLCPYLPPSQKQKMSKISHFQQIFGFLPPQNHILPPRCPPPQKKNLVPPLLRGYPRRSLIFEDFVHFLKT